jgi:hypothetical protein
VASRQQDDRDDEERNSRVLHTRIPESLEDVIKSRAKRLRIPVSNLVRNALEQTFRLVEDVVDDGLQIANTARRGAERVREATQRARGQEAAIYGWQELVLNRDERCRDCGAELDRGVRGFRGLSDQPGAPTVFLCPACVAKIGRE